MRQSSKMSTGARQKLLLAKVSKFLALKVLEISNRQISDSTSYLITFIRSTQHCTLGGTFSYLKCCKLACTFLQTSYEIALNVKMWVWKIAYYTFCTVVGSWCIEYQRTKLLFVTICINKFLKEHFGHLTKQSETFQALWLMNNVIPLRNPPFSFFYQYNNKTDYFGNFLWKIPFPEQVLYLSHIFTVTTTPFVKLFL